jgi:hypothetical protein
MFRIKFCLSLIAINGNQELNLINVFNHEVKKTFQSKNNDSNKPCIRNI